MNCEFAYDLPYSRKSKFSLIPGAGSNNKRHLRKFCSYMNFPNKIDFKMWENMFDVKYH